MNKKERSQFTFNGFLRVDFQRSGVTSDADLLLVREKDERLGLATLIAEHAQTETHDGVVLDLDSSDSPVHGQQQASV